MSSTKQIRVLMLMHVGFDALDFFGPLEMLSQARIPTTSDSATDTPHASSLPFQIVTTGPAPLMTTDSGIKVASSIDMQEAYRRLVEFDILIIPGGNSAEVLKSQTEPMSLIKAFASLPPRPSWQRVIMSVCTGALFLAKAEVLEGQTATTNTQHLYQLRQMVAGAQTKVVEHGERFVVNPIGGVPGIGLPGYRIITSAGPGAGLDLSLWLIEHCCGEQTRKDVEDLVEYQARLRDGLVLG